MPPISVTGRDDKITARHRSHVEEKVGKLERYFSGIVKMEVVLAHGPTQAEVELLISVAGGKKIVCQAEAKDLYAAVDKVVDKAESQLTRHKEKTRGRKGRERTANAAPAPGEQFAALEEEEAYQDIVEKRSFP